MRLIDADKLKRKAQKVGTEAWKMKLTAPIETTLNQFIDWIDEAPTIEPKRGEWIITEQDNGHKWTHRKCSECGKGVIEPLGVSAMKFCPNCGSKMRGEHDD